MNFKKDIFCNDCERSYQVEIPNQPGTHTVRCPYCSSEHSITIDPPAAPVINDTVKWHINCSNCKRKFVVDTPNMPGVHSVRCPYCSTEQNLQIDKPFQSKPVANPEVVAHNVRTFEIISNVLWLILGIIQCITLYAVVAGIWNIVNSILALRNVKNMTAGNPNVISHYENNTTSLIIFAAINLFLGGVVGIVLVLFDFYIRSYVLKNRSAFQAPEQEPVMQNQNTNTQ